MQKRDVLILLLAVVMAAGIAVGVFLTDGIETGSWGPLWGMQPGIN